MTGDTHRLLRFLGGRGYLQSGGWEPHYPTTAPNSLYASRWPLGKGATASAAFTIVSRGAKQV